MRHFTTWFLQPAFFIIPCVFSFSFSSSSVYLPSPPHSLGQSEKFGVLWRRTQHSWTDAKGRFYFRDMIIACCYYSVFQTPYIRYGVLCSGALPLPARVPPSRLIIIKSLRLFSYERTECAAFFPFFLRPPNPLLSFASPCRCHAAEWSFIFIDIRQSSGGTILARKCRNLCDTIELAWRMASLLEIYKLLLTGDRHPIN